MRACTLCFVYQWRAASNWPKGRVPVSDLLRCCLHHSPTPPTVKFLPSQISWAGMEGMWAVRVERLLWNCVTRLYFQALRDKCCWIGSSDRGGFLFKNRKWELRLLGEDRWSSENSDCPWCVEKCRKWRSRVLGWVSLEVDIHENVF